MTASIPGQDLLLHSGICRFEDPFSPEEIASFNAVLDQHFAAQSAIARAYAHNDELFALGLFDRLFSPALRRILFSVMPDPVLYHCHVYEIAGNDPRPHIFSNELHGWHRDTDSKLINGELTHLSLFLYLSDVGPQDGGFEFVASDPRAGIKPSTPTTLVMGPPGFTFVWQRSFYHRASPNRGPRRRRLFKISIQNNRFISTHLSNAHFSALNKMHPSGDIEMDILLGRYQGQVPPALPTPIAPPAYAIAPTGRIEIPNSDITKAKLRGLARQVRDKLLRTDAGHPAAYD